MATAKHPDWAKMASAEGTNLQADAMKATLSQQQKALPLLVKLMEHNARLKRIQYNAYRKAGFSAEESLKLICQHD